MLLRIMAVAPFFDGVAIRYVLPILCLTSFLYRVSNGP